MEGVMREKKAEAKETPKLEVGALLEVKGADGEMHEAAVLEATDDNSVDLVYNRKKEGGFVELVVEKQTPEKAVEATAEVAEVAPDAALEATAEEIDDAGRDSFKKVNKSKWSLAGAANKLWDAAKNSEAGEFMADLKTMAMGDETVGGQEEGVIGQESVFGAAKRGMEMVWGIPKDLREAFAKREQEEADVSALKMEMDFSDYDAMSKEEAAAFNAKEESRWGVTETVRNALHHIKTEMVRPVLTGNLEMVSYVQKKMSLMSEAPVDLGPEYQSLEELDADIEFYGMEFDETVAAENTKLDTAVSKRRLDKLQEVLSSDELLERTMKAKETLMNQKDGLTLSERRDAMRKIEKEIMDLESIKAELDALTVREPANNNDNFEPAAAAANG